MTDQKEHNKSLVNSKAHWEKVYAGKVFTQVSWYQQYPQISLALIKAAAIDKSARIIDIGGGASTLVDFLLEAGYHHLSVLDIAHGAIEQAKTRLALKSDKQAESVNWLEQDIISFVAHEKYDIWHDRAVFHFLCNDSERAAYVDVMSDALNQDSSVIIATFSPDGPEKCSGLDIVRYSPEALSAVLGERFQLVESREEMHVTPGAGEQKFVYCRFNKR